MAEREARQRQYDYRAVSLAEFSCIVYFAVRTNQSCMACLLDKLRYS